MERIKYTAPQTAVKHVKLQNMIASSYSSTSPQLGSHAKISTGQLYLQEGSKDGLMSDNYTFNAAEWTEE